jgi:glycosyltransferase involved in cell wall biosynthesis
MKRLSVVIIARNEEQALPRCLDSVSWADEVVVVDSHSTDRTCEIARQRGAMVCVIDWRGFGPAKQAGVERASGDWILSIDADEEVSDALADDIRHVLENSGGYDGFNIPRRTNFLGRWIYHGGWYPDYVLRLFRREKGKFDDAVVHEKVLLDGPQGRLKGELLHYSFPSLEHYFVKFNRYTSLGAEEAFRVGRAASWADIILRPPVSFLKHYVLHGGFLDGIEGFLVASLSATAVMVKYAKLMQLRRTARTTRESNDAKHA